MNGSSRAYLMVPFTDHIISASLSINTTEHKQYWNRTFAYPMCRSVWKVYCGKMADWIRMPFGVVSGIHWGIGLGVLDGGDRQRRRGSFGGKWAASHCNWWWLCCVVLWKRRTLPKLLWGKTCSNHKVDHWWFWRVSTALDQRCNNASHTPPGTPYTMGSSSLGDRHCQEQDATNIRQQGCYPAHDIAVRLRTML